jgi:hypothetical protein
MFGDYDQNRFLRCGDGMAGPGLGPEPTTRLEIAIDRLCDTVVTGRFNGNITERQAIEFIRTLEHRNKIRKRKK